MITKSLDALDKKKFLVSDVDERWMNSDVERRTWLTRGQKYNSRFPKCRKYVRAEMQVTSLMDESNNALWLVSNWIWVFYGMN